MFLAHGVMPMVWMLVGQYVPEVGEFASNQALRAAGMQVYWQADLPVSPLEHAELATLLDGTIYVVTDRGGVVAVDGATGLPLWVRNLNAGRYRLLKPTHLWTPDGPGPVVVVGAGQAYILDRETGQPIGGFALPFAYGTPAVGDDETVYLGSADGHVYALRWAATRSGGNAVRAWRVAAGGPVLALPAYDGHDLFFATASGELASCVAQDKLRNWVRTLDGSAATSVIRHEGGIYVGTITRMLYRVDADTGRLRWRTRLPVPIEADPVIAGTTLYQDCADAGLHAVDLDTGRIVWRQLAARSFVARRGDEVVALDVGGDRLLMLDNATGLPLSRCPSGLEVYNADFVLPNPADDAVYVVSKGNQVICLRPADVPYLTLEALAAARARLATHAEAAE